MNTILDIIGSFIIGGFLLLIALTMLDTNTKHFYANGDDLIVQQNLTAITRTLEFDLKKMGYGIPEWNNIVITADSTDLKFRSDINRNGVIDTVQWAGFRAAIDDSRYADKLAELIGTTEAKQKLNRYSREVH